MDTGECKAHKHSNDARLHGHTQRALERRWCAGCEKEGKHLTVTVVRSLLQVYEMAASTDMATIVQFFLHEDTAQLYDRQLVLTRRLVKAASSNGFTPLELQYVPTLLSLLEERSQVLDLYLCSAKHSLHGCSHKSFLLTQDSSLEQAKLFLEQQLAVIQCCAMPLLCSKAGESKSRAAVDATTAVYAVLGHYLTAQHDAQVQIASAGKHIVKDARRLLIDYHELHRWPTVDAVMSYQELATDS
jgi:hypothetical protein